LTIGGLGSVEEKAASTLADFVLLEMFATGREDAKGRHQDRGTAAART
jgi:multiple sugar transport system substrate-binding protein